MARSKLSEQEQQQIVSAYRGSAATAVELAEQFQVSITTITRVLKENIAADEYQRLIHLKRSAARRKDMGEKAVVGGIPAPEQQILPLEPELPFSSPSLQPNANDEGEDNTAGTESLPKLPPEELQLAAELQEDVEDVGEEDEEETEEDRDLEDEDEDDPDYLLEDEDGPEEDPLTDPGYQIQVLPLEELTLPETCYVVVDRYQELTTRPLKEFFGSGSLPIEGMDNANTLPIFDSHKVARRFSEMSRRGSNTYPPYRVIQFPGYILEIVRTQLQKKGITHLLMDGQIYSL
ncbi:MAG: hypothetical protein RRA39_04105 [Cyanobacteriota bacterium PSP.bin.10]|jgi:hypothetical protein|nr:hypothetical protein [Cyanobacteriota bacterium PSP.bin.10]